MRIFHCGAALAAVMGAGLAAGPSASADEALDSAIRHLRRAVVRQRDNSHLAYIYALRQLRDPTLRSFFHQLVQHEDWQAQVHAILGLAELGDEQRIDSWLITRVTPAAREQAIVEAIDMDLVTISALRELLAWEELEAGPRSMVLAELVLRDEPVDREQLARLAGHAAMRIAGLASASLAQLGDGTAFETYRGRLNAQSRARRSDHTIWLFDAIRQYRMSSLIPWVTEQVRAEPPGDDSLIAYWGVYTVLQFDQAVGLDLWRRYLGSDASHSRTVRYAQLLLRTEPPLPASAYDRLPRGDDLVESMARAGRAMAAGNDRVDALTSLFDVGHRKSSEWVVEVGDRLPPAEAAEVYGHLIDRVSGEEFGRSSRADLAVLATAKLFKLERDDVLRRLTEAEDDSLTQQAILLGLFDARDPVVAEAVGQLRRIGSGQADSLALLLLARFRERMDVNDVRQLGLIAAGGGRVSDLLQTQAAWLYVRHTGAVDAALARIFADS